MGRKTKKNVFEDERKALYDLIADFNDKLTIFPQNFLTAKEKNKFNSILTKTTEFLTDLNISQPNEFIKVEIIKKIEYPIELNDMSLVFCFPPYIPICLIVNDKNQLPINSTDLQNTLKVLIFPSDSMAKYHQIKKTKSLLIPKIKPNKHNQYWIRKIYDSYETKKRAIESTLQNNNRSDEPLFNE